MSSDRDGRAELSTLPPMRDSEQISTGDIQAVAKVGAICALYRADVRELSAADVADRTGLNRTTAYRYCSSMVAAGLLERGSRRGSFALGSLLLEIGARALAHQRVVEVAPPHLRALSREVGRTAVLSLPATDGPVVTLVEEDASREVVVTVRAGTRLTWSAAQTLVFLAFDPTTVGGVRHGLAPEQLARLDHDVTMVRAQGYSIVDQRDGVFAVAAPVFDSNGLCATVAVLGAGTVEEFRVVEESRVVECLVATARRLGEEISDHGDRGA